MMDPQMIEVVGVGVAGASLGLRALFARAVKGEALKAAAPDIAKFDTTHTAYVAPLHADLKQQAAFLGEMLKKSDELRAKFKGEFDKLKIPEIKDIPSHRILIDEMKEVGEAIAYATAGIMAYKFTSVYRDHVMHRMAEAAGQHPAAEVFVNHFDKAAIAALDQMGVTDQVMEAVGQLAQAMPQQVSDAAFGIIHEAMLPGVMTAVTTVINETRLAMNGQTNWGQSLAYGVAPAAGIFASIKAGAAIDLASGGATMGLGMIGGAIVGIFGRHVFLQSSLEGKIDKLRPHAAEVEAHRTQANTEINKVIVDEFRDVPGMVAACPKLTDDKHMKKIFADLAAAAAADFETSRGNINRAYGARVAALPPAPWYEKMLLINRNGAVAKQYRASAKRQIAVLNTARNDFTTALSRDPVRAVEMLTTQPQFRGGKFEAQLGALRGAFRPAAAAYDASLNGWAQGCQTKWQAGQDAVGAVSQKHQDLMAKLRERLAPIVNPICQEVASLSQRLNRAPDPIVHTFR